MELLVFVLIAGVAGYLLARSNLSKPIDQSAQKVADASQKAAKTTGGWLDDAVGWVRKTFRLEKQAKDEVVDAAEVKQEQQPAVPAEPTPPAAKQTSRRRSDTTQAE